MAYNQLSFLQLGPNALFANNSAIPVGIDVDAAQSSPELAAKLPDLLRKIDTDRINPGTKYLTQKNKAAVGERIGSGGQELGVLGLLERAGCGIGSGGALCIQLGASVVNMINATITGNQAVSGGGMYLDARGCRTGGPSQDTFSSCSGHI